MLLAGLLAAVGGDNAGYAIGRYGGRELVQRFGPYVLLTPDRLAKTERFFARRGHPGGLGRALRRRTAPGQRHRSGAGSDELAPLFGLQRTGIRGVGDPVWVLAGYLAGNHIEPLYAAFQRYGIYLLATCAAVAFAVLAGLAMRRRQQA